MKLLLTSAGIKNPSLHDALTDLLGKPVAEATALCIPTAVYGHPLAGPRMAWKIIAGREPRTPMCELGWKSLGVLELTALLSLDQDRWVPLVQETDALLVAGGEATYLAYWLRRSGLADLFGALRKTVYMGVSGGSLAMAPKIGEEFVSWRPPDGSDDGLGLVEFSMFPHLDNEDLPDNSMANAAKWAARLPVPGYAIDDQTAIRVTDGSVEVVSEGHWQRFDAGAGAPGGN
ncbi:MAG: Type 1 glutamine amidotransferase-like domain-containing protein [Candidatus Dormibacteraceae bacterium]